MKVALGLRSFSVWNRVLLLLYFIFLLFSGSNSLWVSGMMYGHRWVSYCSTSALLDLGTCGFPFRPLSQKLAIQTSGWLLNHVVKQLRTFISTLPHLICISLRLLTSMNGELKEPHSQPTLLQLHGNACDRDQRRNLGLIVYGSKVLFLKLLLICGLQTLTCCWLEWGSFRGDFKFLQLEVTLKQGITCYELSHSVGRFGSTFSFG